MAWKTFLKVLSILLTKYSYVLPQIPSLYSFMLKENGWITKVNLKSLRAVLTQNFKTLFFLIL